MATPPNSTEMSSTSTSSILSSMQATDLSNVVEVVSGMMIDSTAAIMQHTTLKQAPPALPQVTIANVVETTTLTVFPKLPIELRDMIWHLAAKKRRIIKVHPDDTDHVKASQGYYADRTWRNYHAKPSCEDGLIPAILHVNRESREVGLKYYQLSFKHQLRQKSIYFNFNIDVIYIPDNYAWKSFTRAKITPFKNFVDAVSNKVQFLAISGARTVKMERWLRHLFGGLKALVLEASFNPAEDEQVKTQLEDFWTAKALAKDANAVVTLPKILFSPRHAMSLYLGGLLIGTDGSVAEA